MPQKDKTKCCEKPEHLNGKPEECSTEQIRRCHGEADKHSCCALKKTPK